MPRILIVDDEQELGIFLAEEFKDRGLDVDTALKGLEAVESVMAKSPDIVLLDVRMPGMDGIAALKKIKDINPALKVVMMTAFQDEEIMEQARALGAIDYIKKPVSLAYLDTVIMGKISSLLDPP
jgi:two-component system response regulator (stage 0 sporulation protein F)